MGLFGDLFDELKEGVKEEASNVAREIGKETVKSVFESLTSTVNDKQQELVNYYTNIVRDGYSTKLDNNLNIEEIVKKLSVGSNVNWYLKSFPKDNNDLQDSYLVEAVWKENDTNISMLFLLPKQPFMLLGLNIDGKELDEKDSIELIKGNLSGINTVKYGYLLDLSKEYPIGAIFDEIFDDVRWYSKELEDSIPESKTYKLIEAYAKENDKDIIIQFLVSKTKSEFLLYGASVEDKFIQAEDFIEILKS